jgi:hypothetical protein
MWKNFTELQAAYSAIIHVRQTKRNLRNGLLNETRAHECGHATEFGKVDRKWRETAGRPQSLYIPPDVSQDIQLSRLWHQSRSYCKKMQSLYRVLQKELYNFESLYKSILRTCTVF